LADNATPVSDERSTSARKATANFHEKRIFKLRSDDDQ
jgi:hypothetical protein